MQASSRAGETGKLFCSGQRPKWRGRDHMASILNNPDSFKETDRQRELRISWSIFESHFVTNTSIRKSCSNPKNG